MSQPPFTIRLFGPPEFRVHGEPLPHLKTRKGLYILALLTLRQGREVERSWLAGTLWPENDEETALMYLRQALTNLRRALGDQADRLLSPSKKTLCLDLDNAADNIDFVVFERCLKRGDSTSLNHAVSLYRGPLMEGWTEEWLLIERGTCAQAYLAAVETLAEQAMASRETSSALPYLRQIVAADPLRESTCRTLMQALATTRDYASVTQVYRELRAALHREVNAAPSVETQALFAELRKEARRQAESHSATRIDAPPSAEHTIAPIASSPHSLPHPISEFIGRMREREAIKLALAASRLVTLTGIGGVGKTRLALRVAEDVADDFPDGVRFVDLSALTSPALVARKTAEALDIAEQSGRDLVDTLRTHLHSRHLLLVLDNCEHLSEACAVVAAALLQASPNVRILATSRQRLGITGETVRRIPPLALPDPTLLHEEDKNAPAALIESEAVRLFVDRAQRVQPNLHLNPRMLRSIAVLCRRLEGIPLALELAAARMTALGPEQITARLKERFRLLTGGDRSAPARLRTLRAALDWSFDLLQSEEQVLLRRLSIFVGGWTLEAAESVCAESGLEEWEILDHLTALADHSLILVESENGQARYRLLETVREYGQERLRDCPADESLQLRARHRDYYLRFVQDATSHLGGPDQALWLDRLERDHDNLRAALDGCLDEGTSEAIRIGLQLSGDLVRFWTQRNHVAEGRQRYATFLSRAPADLALSPERSRALLTSGMLAKNHGDYAEAREQIEQALAIHQQTGNRRSQATPLQVLGEVALNQGDYPRAQKLLEQALPLVREAGFRPGEAAILNAMGNARANLGDFAEARSLIEQALAIAQELGDHTIEANILNGLGILAGLQNDLPQAKIRYEQALARNREIGNVALIILNLYNLAEVDERLGNAARAEELYRQALLLHRKDENSRNKLLTTYLLMGLATTAQMHGRPERSAQLLGASDAQREILGVPRDANEQAQYENLIAALKAELGAETFVHIWEEGRAQGVDKAMLLAIQE